MIIRSHFELSYLLLDGIDNTNILLY